MGLLIVVAFLVVLLLLIYLIDRVNTIERETRSQKNHPVASAAPKGPYAGLSGRKLWDAVVGAPPSGIDAAEWAQVRNRYALLLQLHIESLFAEGQKDAQRGMSGEPKNPRSIATPDGPIESWLPLDPVQSIYKAGLESVTLTEDALVGVRLSLNEAAKGLYVEAGFAQFPVQSDLLLPGPLPQAVYELGLPLEPQTDSSRPPAPGPSTPT